MKTMLKTLAAKMLGPREMSAPNPWRPRAFVFVDRAPTQAELRRRRGLELHEALPLYQLLRRKAAAKRMPPCPDAPPLPRAAGALDADWEATMLAVAARNPPLPSCEEAARHAFPPGPRYCRRSLDAGAPLILARGRCLACENPPKEEPACPAPST